MAEKMKFDVLIDQEAMDVGVKMLEAAIKRHLDLGSKVPPPAAAICVATHLAIVMSQQYDFPATAFLETLKANLIFAGEDMDTTKLQSEVVTFKPLAPPGTKVN